ncbi:ethanolamine ammonia-lyase subunit EutC [Salinarimonas soli]|uniref:Ethanolamine ammonia-lyase small subunit n=1 Tax=Salinarimonas soli TaxID=1638099 RepID=A0A5B2VHY9_9HYPH|nr:ethanolamine ammonia-lyase subunit EutC [Salinarimonas soli]KAA2237807.1 ethanolamine ammonia-lyase subunit EutC [Salinarimonas soli]
MKRPTPPTDGADPWARLRALTPARIGLPRTGASLSTDAVLRFAMAHAEARDAVHTPADMEALREPLARVGFPTIPVSSAVGSRGTYLRRPDLGRRLSPESRARIEAEARGLVDIALVVADGLSSTAVQAGAVPLLEAFAPWIAREGWSVAPVSLAVQARVALGDEIGALFRARAVVVLVGERPGLSASDSLGLYLTYDPRVGRTDAQRNCISNVRPGGLSHGESAFKLHWLLRRALDLRLSGVALKDESDLAALEPRPEAARLGPGDA